MAGDDDDDDAWLVVISLIPKLIFVHLFGLCGSKIKKRHDIFYN